MARHIVMLAGGQGSRLMPYRTIVPKPLMPVGDRAVLELTLRHAAAHGFTDVTLAVGDLAPLIQAMFGDGTRLGVSLSYSQEHEPLGTGGVLRALSLEEPFLLMNGNVLTTLDLRRFYEAHVASGDAVTIAVHRREVLTDFGVVETTSTIGGGTDEVRGYVDKPSTTHTVSMGVYAVQPGVRELVRDGERLGIPTLIERAIEAGHRVGAYEYDGMWLDLRRADDYEQATARYHEILPYFAAVPEREAA